MGEAIINMLLVKELAASSPENGVLLVTLASRDEIDLQTKPKQVGFTTSGQWSQQLQAPSERVACFVLEDAVKFGWATPFHSAAHLLKLVLTPLPTRSAKCLQWNFHYHGRLLRDCSEASRADEFPRALLQIQSLGESQKFETAPVWHCARH